MSEILLHLSHTDIRCDSRILKELRALEDLDSFDRVALGVELDEGASVNDQPLKARIVTIRLLTKVFRWLPRPLRYALNMIELTSSFVLSGMKIKPAVVHCHDTVVLPAGVLIKLFTRCKLVYDAHELESNKNGQSLILSRATLLIERVCWRWVDLLVSVSDSIIEWYTDHLGPKKSILVLNSPEINRDFESKTDAQVPGRYFHLLYKIPEDKLIFVYLGILGSGRGIEIALEAFASSSVDAHLVLVGYGDLSELINSYSVRYSNIHLHQPVPHDQVVGLVSDADVGLCLIENVSLSDYYCLPNKLFEYGFAGLHVLASNFPEIQKVVEKYAIGTCCTLEPMKVRDAIQFLTDHRPVRRSVDLSDLSWGAQAVRLVHAYCDLLEPRPTLKSTEKRMQRS